MRWSQFSGATFMLAWTGALGTGVDIVAVMSSANPSFTPSLDNMGREVTTLLAGRQRNVGEWAEMLEKVSVGKGRLRGQNGR